MDPTQCLADIRELVNESPEVDDIDALPEKVKALDEWMTKGGFPPQQWRRLPGRSPLTEPGDILSGVKHGKRKSYDAGCKCLACRAANRLRRNLTPVELREY